jgi:predicted patatin/cPLA2 family phospholipase
MRGLKLARRQRFYRLLQPTFRLTLISLTILLTAGCATIVPRNVLPQANAGQIELEGFHNIRFWGDASARDIQAIMMADAPKAETRLSLGVERHQPVSNLLAISGGAEDGAYGAGLLVGWSDAGTRPVFDLVTGVSSGALIAPFVYLGREHDNQLREIFTKYGRKDIFTYNVPGLLEGSALADDAPLARLIEKYVDDAFLKEIARERIKGRILLIGTTNLDTQRPVLWDMGRIAMSNNRDAMVLFRKILLASATLPGVFPPVRIQVRVGGQNYDELHVDGGVTRQVFIAPSIFRLFPTIRNWEDLQRSRDCSLSEMEKSIPNGNPSTRMSCRLRSVPSQRLSRIRESEISTASILSPSATELTSTLRAFHPTLATPAVNRSTRDI